jgi:hypothetical protein
MKRYCKACVGAGWLPSLPEGRSTCLYCHGRGWVRELMCKRCGQILGGHNQAIHPKPCRKAL